MDNQQSEFWQGEAVAFLGLASIKGVGYWGLYRVAETKIGFKKLLKEGSPQDLEKYLKVKLDMPATALEEYRREIWEKGAESLKALVKDGISLSFNGQQGFPEKLTKIPDPPYWLFIQGDPGNLHKNSIAVVGTRKPSTDGIFLTRYLITALSNVSVPTVSGIALGIDQIAHLESLRFGIPTIAVLGTGIYNNYPKGSESIRANIIDGGGAVVSEYLPTQSYSAETFVRRNRLQAGLCEILMPVEWQIKSGTAHTVDFAGKYGRKIVNIYLPKTYDMRPELSFAEHKFQAKSFEVPTSHSHLFDYLSENLHQTFGPDAAGTERTKANQTAFDF